MAGAGARGKRSCIVRTAGGWPLLRCLVACCLTGWLILAVPSAAPGADSPSSALTLRVENDAVKSTDANYTSGLSLSYTCSDSGVWEGVWRAAGLDRGRPYSSYELAQLIFTPSDLDRVPPDPRDRPYVGILYLGMTTGLQTDASLHALKLLLGVVGPSSLGESGQKLAHHVTGNTLPKGWSYQLKDEPIMNLLYEYRHRYRLSGSDDGFGVELIPIATAMAGNYLVKARAEGELRFGLRLPDDFGNTSIRGLSTPPLPRERAGVADSGIYLYAGGGGEAIARDITIDGNTFRSAPHVDREPLVSSGVIGLAFRNGSFLGELSYILRGREFPAQHRGEQYGSLSLTYQF